LGRHHDDEICNSVSRTVAVSSLLLQDASYPEDYQDDRLHGENNVESSRPHHQTTLRLDGHKRHFLGAVVLKYEYDVVSLFHWFSKRPMRLRDGIRYGLLCIFSGPGRYHDVSIFHDIGNRQTDKLAQKGLGIRDRKNNNQ